MSAQIIPFDSHFSTLKNAFIRSPLYTEHKVGFFMQEVEKLARTEQLMQGDFIKIQEEVSKMLSRQCMTVQGLQSLEQWQRNAFAAQLGQAFLKKVEDELMYECEEAAHSLKEQLGIGKTARAFMQREAAMGKNSDYAKMISPDVDEYSENQGENVLNFARRVRKKEAEAKNSLNR